MNKRIAGICCMLLGAMLLAGAALLIRENHIEEAQAGSEAATILTALQQELARENSALLLPNEPPSAETKPEPRSQEASDLFTSPSDEALSAAISSSQSEYDGLETILPTEYADIETSHIEAPNTVNDEFIGAPPSVEEATISPIQPTASPAAIETRPSSSPSVLPEMPTLQIGKQSYIGYIELPTLGLSLPVMSEWSYPKLRIAPCRYTGSVYDDSLIILAHNYTRHFGGIKDLAIGDPVQFIDAEGNIYQYTVAKHETLEKKDVREMVDNEYDLTLFTCTYGGRNRITVRLTRIRAYE